MECARHEAVGVIGRKAEDGVARGSDIHGHLAIVAVFGQLVLLICGCHAYLQPPTVNMAHGKMQLRDGSMAPIRVMMNPEERRVTVIGGSIHTTLGKS